MKMDEPSPCENGLIQDESPRNAEPAESDITDSDDVAASPKADHSGRMEKQGKDDNVETTTMELDDGPRPPNADRTDHEKLSKDDLVDENGSTTTGLDDQTLDNGPRQRPKNDLDGESVGLDDGSGNAERDELMEKFLEYCKKFKVNSSDDSNRPSRERFRVTDLLKRFVDDEFRPSETSKTGPLTFQKLLRKMEFGVPASISLPPSQVVDLLVETSPEKSMKELRREIGSSKSQDSEESTTFRRQFDRYPAPNMTRFLYDIGYGLASEAAYRSVLSKAVSDLSSSSTSANANVVQRQTQLVDHIRQVYEDTRKLNHAFKLKTRRCPVDGCNFSAETELQLHEHQRKPHKKTHRWLCALCMVYSTSNEEDMEEHYDDEHGFTSSAVWDAPVMRAPCPFCDQDFQYKAQLKTHLRTPFECPWNRRRVKIMAGCESEAQDVLNVRLWPEVDEVQSNVPQKKPQLSAKPPLRPAPRLDRKVADVVSLVASGHGNLRAPPKANLGSLNLPRLYPATKPNVLKTSQMAQQQLLQQHQFMRQIYLQQQQQAPPTLVTVPAPAPSIQRPVMPLPLVTQRPAVTEVNCEICDMPYPRKVDYLKHLQMDHRKFLDKSSSTFIGAAPLACSRCRDRFYSYEGLERHLLMEHDLVTNELLSKAQRKQDSGKCKVCTRIYAFNLLQHLVQDHQRTLCSAEIVYSCDVCSFRCNSYVQLEQHLRGHHSEQATSSSKANGSSVSNAANHPSASAQDRQRPQLSRLEQCATRIYGQPQTAADVLNAALGNQKKPLPAAHKRPTELADHYPMSMERPPKLAKMMDADQLAVDQLNSKARIPSTATGRPGASQHASSRKQLRYCCTPCDLKFISYEAVLKHWVERHLKPLRVPLCRIDKCVGCQKELGTTVDEAQERAEGETSAADGQNDGPGLILDFELPELSGENSEAEDDDVVLLPSPPAEVIYLD